MKPACPDCDWIHVPSAVVAVGKFNPTGPSGYRAPDGPLRATRSEAEADLCHKAEITPAADREQIHETTGADA